MPRKRGFAATLALPTLALLAPAVLCVPVCVTAAPAAPAANVPAAPAISVPASAVAAEPAGLVRAAEQLVGELVPERNVYGSHPTEVVWADSAAGIEASNRSVCSSFFSHLLERVYGVTPAQLAVLTGKRNPHARDYYQAIVAQRGFRRVMTVDAIRPGDVIALSYPPGSGATGHVMLVDAPPELRVATAPLLAGTRQYAVTVIDSSRSVHGLGDTRGTPAQHGTGVGRGEVRLYADRAGAIVASAWSLGSRSRLSDVRERKLAIGRVDLASSVLPLSPEPSSGTQPNDDLPAHER
jgi:hypothetical protein